VSLLSVVARYNTRATDSSVFQLEKIPLRLDTGTVREARASASARFQDGAV
jgi:hypothetical protein